MLPIFRIVSVGGVFLAILILVLAVSPPGASRPQVTRDMMPARGALLTRSEHPEWRALLIKAALRRADELNELRALHAKPGEPAEPPEAKGEPAASAQNEKTLPTDPGSVVAALPQPGAAEAAPEDPTSDATGSVVVDESETALPAADGNAAPIAGPIVLPTPRPRIAEPAAKSTDKPKRAERASKPRRTTRRSRRVRVSPQQQPQQINLFQALFNPPLQPGAADARRTTTP